jgi:hypothetical protein
MRNALCYLFFLFAGILPLAGQSDSRGGGKPPKPGRSAWFACISAIPAGVENPAKVMSGKNLTELKLPRYMTSEPVEITADGIIRIVRETPDPENPEEMKYLILAEAKIPDNVREALIILFPLAEPKGDLIFHAMVQDLASFKGGDRLYINLSDAHIRVKLGNTKVIVAPKKSKIYESPVLAKPTNIPIMYDFYHPEKKEWRMFNASTVVLRPTRRKICIFNSGTRLGNIKKHAVLFPVQRKKP